MRYAIYFTPPREAALTRRAAEWLGRDPFTGATPPTPASEHLTPAEIAFHTAAARRYGFHATIKAPFRLAEGQTEAALDGALAAFCARAGPVTIPAVALARIDGFFALVPAAPNAALDAFAGRVVEAFEPFRAPLTEAEIERRNPDRLSAAELSNLCQWGYPYVFDSFRFHMTLSGRVARTETGRVEAAIRAFFGRLIDQPLVVDGLALFVEDDDGAPFNVRSRHAMGRRSERKSA